MKTTNLLAPFVILCAAVALVGCASTDRRVSASALNDKNLQRTEAPPAPALSQPEVLDESAFRGLDLASNEPVTLDKWQRLDTSAGPKDNSSALGVNADAPSNATEFLMQTPKDSKRYHFFGDPENTNKNNSSWDSEEFQQQGLRLFSFHF